MRTTANRRGDVYVINGTKTWITSGKSCDVAILFAVTGNGSKPSRNISAFVCPKNIPGLHVGKLENKMGIRASETTQLIYEDAELPAENLLGEEGEGFKIAMSLLDGGRIGIAAQGVGIAQRAFDEAVSYSLQREQFGGPIADKQAIQFMLADMATGLSAARLLLYRAATMKDKGQRVSKEASMAKLFRLRARHEKRLGRRANPRRLRLRQGIAGRALLPRRQNHRDLRRHLADTARRDSL